MPRMITCRLDDRVMGIEEALAMRDAEPEIARNFRCCGCREPVRPFRAARDGNFAAHFEHCDAVPDCPVWQPGGAC